ncbi:DUF6443 domain-containing protein [Flavobacterium sp.]|uniref:DUF6443 domain-containing protein n=1 Tax=Flavobacterium sp. TaxID=239 RepID=UPI0039E4FE3B
MKAIYNNIITLSFFLILLANVASAQEATDFIQNRFNSPDSNVSGNSTSVDLHHGKANISIPIFEYKGRELNLPISMGYTTSGAKVEDVASCIGLGWNLSAGGRINSMVNVIPDSRYPEENAGSEDRYSLSLPGITEYFRIEYHFVFANINPAIKAELRTGPDDPWIITMPDGAKYFFGQDGKTEIHSTITGTKTTNTTTSWLLTKIISPNGLDEYTFEYQNFVWANAMPNNGKGYIQSYGNSGTASYITPSQYKINQQMLKVIYHNNHKVIGFNYGERDDIAFVDGGNALNSIDFYNYTDVIDDHNTTTDDPVVYRKAIFDFSYFGNGSTATKKLKLDELTFVGVDGLNSLTNGDSYKFAYDREDETPNKLSFGQDYLGLYNGKDSNPDLVDSFDYVNLYPPFTNPTTQKREFIFDKATIGTLNKITYPTGGYTEFEFERNTLDGDFRHEIVPAGIHTSYETTTHAAINAWGGDDFVYGWCTSTTDIHPSMQNVNFADYGDGTVTNNGHVYNVTDVTATMFYIDEEGEYDLTCTGPGIYVIQKLDSLTLEDVDNSPCGSGPYAPPYLIPTESIIYKGNNGPFPIEFIKGGVTYNGTINCQADDVVDLDPGIYQLTLWNYSSETVNVCSTNSSVLLQKTVSIEEPYDAYLLQVDTNGTPADGFRVKSVSNYTKAGGLAGKKVYKYSEGHYYHYINNQNSWTWGRKKSGQGYLYPDVVFYNQVTVIETDSTNQVINGYVRNRFRETNEYEYDESYAWLGMPHNGLRYTYDVNYGNSGLELHIGSMNEHKLREIKAFDNDGKLLRKQKFNYAIGEYTSQWYNPLEGSLESDFYENEHTPFPYFSGSETTEYFSGQQIQTYRTINYSFSQGTDRKFLPIGEVSSAGHVDYSYAQAPNGGYFLSGKVNQSGDGYLSNQVTVGNSVLTDRIYTMTSNTKFEFNARKERVTSISNILGSPMDPTAYEAIIYGYGGRIPVAKISGMKYTDIDTTILDLVEDAANAEYTTANNVALESANKALRTWLRSSLNTVCPNAQATTYTYNPNFGVTSMTNMSEQTVFYEYDALGRPTFTKKLDLDSDAMYIVSEKQYHTRANDSEQNWVKEIVYKEDTTTPIANPTPEQAVVNVTFLDGLGRPIQQTAHQQGFDSATETYSDINTHSSYDILGRQPKTYLPYATGDTNIRFDATEAETISYSEYSGNNPFSEKVFDDTPLNRVLKVSAPGNTGNWAMGSGHEITFEYKLNDGDNVRKFSVLYGALIDDGLYPENSLYKTETKDENGNVTQQFTDVRGLTVLKRSFDEMGTPHDTYYCYDELYSLTMVIPPLAQGTIDANMVKNLCYQYIYDDWIRVIEKQLPGKQREYMVYDGLGRVVATGPAYSPFGGNTGSNPQVGWLRTYYDNMGRVAVTGWEPGEIDSDKRNYLQDTYSNDSHIVSSSGSTTFDGQEVFYSNINTSNDFILLTVNYYDDYRFAPLNDLTVAISEESPYYNNTNKPSGLPTGSWTRVLENGPIKGESSFILYDKWARPIATRKDNYLGGYTNTSSTLNEAGQVSESRIKHKRDNLSSSTEIATQDSFEYNGNGSLKEHYQQIGTLSQQALAKNYYTKLGRIYKKEVGSNLNNEPLQTVDFSYNIRGWLTGINGIGDMTENGQKDLFGFMINYDTMGYGSNVNQDEDADGVHPLFNGNISETYWRSASDNVLRRYGYKYDGLNRMNRGIYNKPEGNVSTNSYNETVNYDANGNITDVQRTGNFDLMGLVNPIDDLTYNYDPDTNRLTAVSDNTNSPKGFKDEPGPVDYTYDLSGNMISDANKNIDSIHYNHLNLPTKIYFQNGDYIDYIYTATGQKIRKDVHDGSAMRDTDYLDGYQYVKKEIKFFPTSEGYVSCIPTSGGNNYRYVYNYKDHLGNIRMCYGLNEEQELTILEENHYYPFGLKHTNYNPTIKEWGTELPSEEVLLREAAPSNPVATSSYKYKFNGVEWQDDLALNLFDMDMRDYDPAIGRWLGIDPVTHHGVSPYVGMDNNPVLLADPAGADAQNPGWTITIDASLFVDNAATLVQIFEEGTLSIKNPKLALEDAIISADVYENGYASSLRAIGWTRSSFSPADVLYRNPDIGFRSGLYQRGNDFVYATAGTDFKSLQDWINNGTQLLGLSEQYSLSVNNATILSGYLKNLRFTGHSLGGGLAEANALATGRTATTFNAAGLSIFTKGKNMLKNSKTDAYILYTDPLNFVQKRNILLPSAGGRHHYIAPTSLSGIYNGHSIDSMIEALGFWGGF